ncbi:hypothetical protein GCM10010214_11100 [Streptomyces abikoensis]|nr:hypothetical protein GCM10010214_11100 [Streptomyces abikoensis]
MDGRVRRPLKSPQTSENPERRGEMNRTGTIDSTVTAVPRSRPLRRASSV